MPCHITRSQRNTIKTIAVLLSSCSLLAYSPAFAADFTVTDGTSGAITGTAGSDTFTATNSTITGNVDLGAGDDTATLNKTTINGDLNMGTGNNATVKISNGSRITDDLFIDADVSIDIDITDSRVDDEFEIGGSGAVTFDSSGSTFADGVYFLGAPTITLNSTGDTFSGSVRTALGGGADTLSFTNSKLTFVDLRGGNDTLTLNNTTASGNLDLGTGDNATISITNGSAITGTINAQSAILDDVDITGSTVTGLITLNGAAVKNIDLSGTTITAGFDIDGAGNVTLNSTGDTYNGDINLTGTSGTNTLSLTNSTVNSSISLGTGNDTVTLNNTTISGALTAGAGDTDSLILSGTGTLTSAASQFENLTVTGTAWTLDNNLTLEGGGSANFNSGIFTISTGRTLTTTNSAVNIANGATVSIKGALNTGNAGLTSNGTLSFNGGTLTSTGLISSTGTLNLDETTITGDGTDGNAVMFGGNVNALNTSVNAINDDLTFATGTKVNFDLGPASTNARINVAGAGSVVNDSAGNITINLKNGGSAAPQTGNTFTLINSANGGINSSNYTITDEFIFISFDLTASNANNLIATATILDFQTVATGQNENAVATALDNGTVSTALNTMLLSLGTQKQASDLYTSQSGIVTTNSMTAVNAAAATVTNIVQGRVSNVGGANITDLPNDGVVIASAEPVPVMSQNNRQYWVEAAGGFGSVDGDSDARGGDHKTFGFAFGAEQNFGRNIEAGLFGAFSRTLSDIDGLNDKSQTNVYRAGAYAGTRLGTSWSVNGSLSGAYLDYDTSRSTGSGTAKADFGGYGAFANVEVAYDVKFPSLSGTLSPYAGLDGSLIHHTDYNESGAGVLNMAVDSTTTENLTSEIGVQYSGSMDSENFTFGSAVKLGWAHEFLDQSAGQSSSFISSSSVSFDTKGPEVSRDSAKIGLALSAKGHTDSYLLYTEYNGELSADASDHLFSAGVKFKW